MKLFNGWRCFLLCLPILILFPHLLTVLEFQKNPTALHSVKSNKFDHLILGPASGQGLSDRLQCKGTKALNRTHFSKSSSTYEDDQISFVTVFTTYKSPIDRFDSVIIGNTTYNKVERSLAVLNVFINFIQMNMPQSKIFILSDPSSKLPVNRNGVLIHPIPGEYSRDKLMLQRIKSYIAFLESRLDEHSNGQGRLSHFIFTDSDIAVVDDLAHIFHENPSFDIALTFRNNKEQPLNSGFIAVRGTVEGILRAKSLLEKVLEVYSLKYMKASRMLGDQLALVWVVKSQALFDVKRFSRREGFVEKIGDTSVLFLPCLRYNWTPPEGAGQFHGMPLDVKVVHFKGSRKRLMLESWNFLSLSSEIGDMLCLILKSGRTKYDF